MVESNKPINSTNNNQVWDGIAIGAGAGAGIAGMTMGAAYKKHLYNEKRREKLFAKNRDAFYEHTEQGGTSESFFKSLGPKKNNILDDELYERSQSRTLHKRMGGGWKRAGLIAGVSALGGIAGGVIDVSQK